MKASELATYKKALLDRRRELAGDVTRMGEDALRKSRQKASGDLSTMPYHMADIGTDNYEQEFTLGMIENEEDEVRAIDEALEKLEKGTYGVCEGCECKIKKPRLRFMPYARNCIECQQEEEKQSGSRR